MAVRFTIFEEIVARLTTIGDAVETELMPSADPMSFPARHIFDSGQSIVESEAGANRYSLSVTIEGYLEKDGGADVHAALNDFYAATIAALVTDPPLGGLAEEIDEGDMRVMVATLASKARLAFAVDLTIQFVTARGDPAQAA